MKIQFIGSRRMNHSTKMHFRSAIPVTLVAIVAIVIAWANHGRADAPPGQFEVAIGMATDTKTGLVWERNPQEAPLTYDNATAYCNNLALGVQAWRLPSLKELQTLVDESVSGPATDSTVFPNTASGPYWTSAPSIAIPLAQRTVDFSTGETSYQLWGNATANVRCVR
jgi:Protein of unknown function (DUF1566)